MTEFTYTVADGVADGSYAPLRDDIVLTAAAAGERQKGARQ
jgi:hypothetical protein